MLLTVFYMVATWIQSWRLSSLRGRLQAILQGPEITRPSLTLYAATQLCIKEESNGNCSKRLLNGNDPSKETLLSSHFCDNSNIAKLGDLLWYQGDKRLCTIYPQQRIDVSSWLLYPYGITIFPLFTYNYAQTPLQQETKMHVLIEADLNSFNPTASTKAAKLEDYGVIVTWTSDDILGVILETDLDNMTKFTSAIMQGQCFINNGLSVTRIESVSVTGKPCTCNYDRFNVICNKKLTSPLQWDSYIKNLSLVSNAARSVAKNNQSMEIKDIPGLAVSPGSKPISLLLPTVLEIKTPSHVPSKSVPTTSPSMPILTSAITNVSNLTTSQALNNSIELNLPTKNSSVRSLSNLCSSRSQEFILEESLRETHLDAKYSSMASSRSSINSSIPNFSPTKKTDLNLKPPNILIYADSAIASENVRSVLQTILKENRYIIYTLSSQEAKHDKWINQANLMIVCGNIGNDVGSQVVEYLVRGGKLLALCSDILKTLLPAFKTAEVRENELVHFSYGKWQNVRMMHHVFCYQASPVKTKFSRDVDDSRSITPPTPILTSVVDSNGKSHTFNVQVLGSEETWHTPSILLANHAESGGKAVFSQIHLEADPSQYELEETKFTVLKQSNPTRLEIFADLLSKQLGMEVTSKPASPPVYTSAFFLGRHEMKMEVLNNLKSKMRSNDTLKTPKLELQFYKTNNDVKPASSTFLPIMVHMCPENFSTVEYFENLATINIGRLVVYADVMTSSNDLVDGLIWKHGMAIIPYRQTEGRGRGNNSWISPKGCAMFTLQLHIPLKSVLGERISIIQHLVTTAVVYALRSLPGYADIDLRIKWPNDIHTSDGTKLGGLMVTSTINPTNIICNLGMGMNLCNESPTTCINQLIKNHNAKNNVKLSQISFEKFFAISFNKIENLLNEVQNGNMEYFLDLYYKYWLHTDAEISIVLPNDKSENARIQGIDTYGFLKVKNNKGKEYTLHPDGNSFDIMNGLVVPKFS